MEDDLSIPDFLKVQNRTGFVSEQSTVTDTYVDPVMQRQREIRAAWAEQDKIKRAAGLEKYKQQIADRHAGEEWNPKTKMWVRTPRSMAKLQAQQEAEFAAQGGE